MTIHMRTDSDGHEHQVWAQEQANSCAVAAMWMARNMAMQATMNESEWQLAWRTYRHVVEGMQWDAIGPPPPAQTLDEAGHAANQDTFENMFATAGTFSTQVAEALRSDGLLVDYVTSRTVMSSLNARRVSEETPAICLFGWYIRDGAGRWIRRGGHFVVAARVASSGRIVFLNPLGGIIQELRNNGRLPYTGRLDEVLYIS